MKTYNDYLKEYEHKVLPEILRMDMSYLKFDLLHRRVVLHQKEISKMIGDDELRYVILEMCKILEVYGFVEEALMFYMVVPEFNKIEQVLAEGVYYLGEYEGGDKNDKNGFARKYRFNVNFLNRLSSFAEKNLRDAIVEKCTRLKLILQ